MRIGFDVSQTGAGKAGCGYVADALLCALGEADRENRYLLYPFFGDGFLDPDAPKTCRRVERPNVRTVLAGPDAAEALAFWRNFPEDGEARLGNPDIVHAHNFFCPDRLRHARLVFTLHDVCFLDHPEFATEANRRLCFDGVFRASLYADLILSVSRHSRDRFLHFFPHFPPNRIRVMHPGSRFAGAGDEEGGPPAGLAPQGYWLSVGTLEPRKNLRRLLVAYAQLRREGRTDLPLALAGGKGWMEEDLVDYIRELGLEDRVKLLGYVSDERLVRLYRGCFAFLYPSLCEGFGLPVLEAMGLGAPVLVSDCASLPEVAGDAALRVDPADSEAIARGMAELAASAALREDLRWRGRKQAAAFSWERAARETLKAYADVLALPRYAPVVGGGD